MRAREEIGERRRLVRVAVIDNGPGIETKHLPRLFERSYRTRQRPLAGGGTGLSLSIVKHLCDALGGNIDVESAVGQGSTFSFTLAQSQPPTESAAPTEAERLSS